jgi:hypothetical protein
MKIATSSWRTAGYVLGASAVLVGGTLAAATLMRTPHAGTPQTASDRDTASEVAALRREVDALKQSQRALMMQRASALAPAETTAAAVTPVAPTAPPVKALTDEEATQKNREIATNLAAHLTSEPVDAAWRAQKLREIRDAFASVPAGSRIEDADCASSLCKLTIVHDTPVLQHEFASHIVNLDAFNAGLFFDYEDKPPRTTVYVVREGHKFSEFEG